MNNAILTEAFKELKILEEEDFNLSSAEDVEEAEDFLDDATEEDTLDIIDLDAEEENELSDSYIGKVVLECEVCHSKIFEDKDNVIFDEETHLANIAEECPYCFSTDGYKVIGEVAPFGEVEEPIEVAEEEPIDTVEDDLGEGGEPKEAEEEEIVEESLNEGYDKSYDYLKEYPGAELIDTIVGVADDAFSISSRAAEKYGYYQGDINFEDIHNAEENPLEVGAEYIIDVYKVPEESWDKPGTGMGMHGEDNCYLMVIRTKLNESLNECGKFKKGECKNDALNEGDVCPECGKNPCECEKDLEEDFKDISVTTDDSHMTMTSDEDGKVTVTTEPVADEFEDDFIEDESGDEMLAPIGDETVMDIAEEQPLDDEEEFEGEGEDIDIDEFDDEGFDELGESYLTKVYENVESFKTQRIKESKNKLYLEGLIKFKSGSQKKTSFIFEAKDINAKGKLRFIGENKEITRGKKAFTVTGKMSGNKFMCESLNYNYRAKNEDGKSTRLYGTIKRK